MITRPTPTGPLVCYSFRPQFSPVITVTQMGGSRARDCLRRRGEEGDRGGDVGEEQVCNSKYLIFDRLFKNRLFAMCFLGCLSF